MTVPKPLVLVLILLCVVLFGLSILVGPAGLSMGDTLRALFLGQGEAATLVMREIRLPRAILAVLVGASLGLAGAAMQGYLRNPLADPGLFGIAPMAALGAVASFWLAPLIPPAWSAWSLPVLALAGAGAGMAALALIAGRTAADAQTGAGGGIALFTLAGLMIASLAGALTALAITLAPNPFALSEIVMWLNGALTDRSWREGAIAAPERQPLPHSPPAYTRELRPVAPGRRHPLRRRARRRQRKQLLHEQLHGERRVPALGSADTRLWDTPAAQRRQPVRQALLPVEYRQPAAGQCRSAALATPVGQHRILSLLSVCGRRFSGD